MEKAASVGGLFLLKLFADELRPHVSCIGRK